MARRPSSFRRRSRRKLTTISLTEVHRASGSHAKDPCVLLRTLDAIGSCVCELAGDGAQPAQPCAQSGVARRQSTCEPRPGSKAELALAWLGFPAVSTEPIGTGPGWIVIGLGPSRRGRRKAPWARKDLALRGSGRRSELGCQLKALFNSDLALRFAAPE